VTFQLLIFFLKRSIYFWEKVAPAKTRNVEKIIERLFDEDKISKEMKLSTDVKIENFCLDFINQIGRG
jgi:hypothetical protein